MPNSQNAEDGSLENESTLSQELIDIIKEELKQHGIVSEATQIKAFDLVEKGAKTYFIDEHDRNVWSYLNEHMKGKHKRINEKFRNDLTLKSAPKLAHVISLLILTNLCCCIGIPCLTIIAIWFENTRPAIDDWGYYIVAAALSISLPLAIHKIFSNAIMTNIREAELELLPDEKEKNDSQISSESSNQESVNNNSSDSEISTSENLSASEGNNVNEVIDSAIEREQIQKANRHKHKHRHRKRTETEPSSETTTTKESHVAKINKMPSSNKNQQMKAC